MSQSAEQNDDAKNALPTPIPPAAPLPSGLLSKYPWLTFLLPFVVYMVIGTLEPKPPPEVSPAEVDTPATAEESGSLSVQYRQYPMVYTAKIVITVAVMLYVLPGYRTFPFRVGLLAPLVGLVGGAVWIGICQLHLEAGALGAIGLADWAQQGARSAYNPLEVLADTPAWAYGFLAIRFFGLVVVVAVMEEFFLRGFLMRYVIAEDWWKLGIGDVNRLAIATVTVFPVLYHPERIAAFVWFSAVTWLMLKTRNIWDCVIAHAVTNLVLGVYVVATGQWWLM